MKRHECKNLFFIELNQEDEVSANEGGDGFAAAMVAEEIEAAKLSLHALAWVNACSRQDGRNEYYRVDRFGLYP